MINGRQLAVPSARLLVLAALIVIPASLMMGRPGMGGISILAMVGVAALAAYDRIASRGRLAGIQVEFPELIRTSKGRDFEIELKVRQAGPLLDSITLALRWDDAFKPDGLAVRLALPPEADFAGHRWPAVALRRGQFVFDRCYFEAPSHLGLWTCRGSREIRCEVRVFPNLLGERKALSALFLHRGNIGAHAMRQVGKGRDFEQLRDYQPGDDYADIFWRGTAKRGHPVTKMFQIERTQEIYVAIDHSRLSAREIRVPLSESEEGEADPAAIDREMAGGGEFEITTELERFLHCALVLGLVAELQGDLFGVATFANRVDKFIRARNGKAHYDTCRDALYTLEPKMVTPDYEELAIFFKKRLTRRSLLIVLTDLSDPLMAESFYESVQLIARRHIILVNMVKPDRAKPLFGSAEGIESATDLYGELGGHFVWQELAEVGKMLGRQGVQFSLPDHASLTTEVVTQYLNVKKRQLL